MILSTSSTTFLITRMLKKFPYDHKSFVPLANLAVDGNNLIVRSDSPFKTIGDLIAEAKKKPKELKQGGVTTAVPMGCCMNALKRRRRQS